MKKFQILVDSSSDLKSDYLNEDDIAFKVIPLTININDEEYIDDDNIDCAELLKKMHESKKNSSACPAPQSFLEEFDNAEYTFIITITSKMSGCYNSALVAQKSYKNPENIFVIDSKQVSGTEILLIDKLAELMKKGLSYEEIKTEIIKYRDERSLYFILQKFDNLVNNGRMNRIAGLIASALVIRPICKAHEGEIKMVKKIIGIKNTFSKLIQMIAEKVKGQSNDKLIISHCFAEEEAKSIKEGLEKETNFKEIKIIPMKGLCSYYSLEKGLIICF